MLEPDQLYDVLRQLAAARDKTQRLRCPIGTGDPLAAGQEARLHALLESFGVQTRWATEASRVASEAFEQRGDALEAGELRALFDLINEVGEEHGPDRLEAYFQRTQWALSESLPSLNAVVRFEDDVEDRLRGQFLELHPLLHAWPRTILEEDAWNTIESPLPGLRDLPLTDTWVHLRLRRLRVDSNDLDAAPGAYLKEVLRSRFYGEPLVDVIYDTRGLTCIVGQPGAGKTTLAKWLAMHLLVEEESPFLIPIHVPLRSFALELAERPRLTLFRYFLEQRGVRDERQITLWERVRAELALSGGASATGRGLFFWLIDGWDEIPQSSTKPLRELVRDRLREIEHEPGLVTTRHSALPYSLPCDRFFELLPLSRPAQKELMTSWLREMDREVAIEDVVNWLDRNPGLRELAASPFLLTLICGIASEPTGRDPLGQVRNRYDLYERAVKAIRDTHGDRRPDAPFTEERLRQTEALAHWLSFDAPEAPKWVFEDDDVARGSRSDQLLRDVLSPSRLICAPNPNSTSHQFLHATLQEFLAAKRLIETGFGDRFASPRELLTNATLVEVLRFVAGARGAAATNGLWLAIRDAIDAPDDYGLLYARAALLLAESDDRDGGERAFGVDLRELIWDVVWKYREYQPAVLIDALMTLDAPDLCRRIFRQVAQNKQSFALVMMVLEQAPNSLLAKFHDDPEFQEWMRDPDLAELFGVLFGEVLGEPQEDQDNEVLRRMHGSLGAGDAAFFVADYRQLLRDHVTNPEAAETAIQLAGELGPAAVEPLAETLQDPDMHLSLRCEAAQSLAECGRHGAAVITRLLAATEDDELLFALLGAIHGNLLSKVESFVVRDILLYSDDPDVRETAAMVLESSRLREATTWLTTAYETEDDIEVRRAILDALGYRGDQAAVPWLWRRLDGDFPGTPEEQTSERESTFKALLELVSRNRHRWDTNPTLRAIEEAITVRLNQILLDPSDPLMMASIRGAARFPEVSSRKLLNLATSHSLDDELREAVCATLGERCELTAMSTLGNLVESARTGGTEDAEENLVARAAARALAKIDPEVLGGLRGPEAERMRAALAFEKGMLFFRDDPEQARRTETVMARSPEQTSAGHEVPRAGVLRDMFVLLSGRAMTIKMLQKELGLQEDSGAEARLAKRMQRLCRPKDESDFGVRHHSTLGYFRLDAPPPELRGTEGLPDSD